MKITSYYMTEVHLGNHTKYLDQLNGRFLLLAETVRKHILKQTFECLFYPLFPYIFLSTN